MPMSTRLPAFPPAITAGAITRQKSARFTPHLNVDLLRLQMDACKEIDINVPVYLTAGVNNVAAHEHPEWRTIREDGRYVGWQASPVKPGFHQLCFNSPYLDHLCRDDSGNCDTLPRSGRNLSGHHKPARLLLPLVPGRHAFSRGSIQQMRTNVRSLPSRYRWSITGRRPRPAQHQDAAMPVFHNSGHIDVGNTEILEHFSHLELESLPTGGWGLRPFSTVRRLRPKARLGLSGE